MSRNGKIARLPRHIRDELNQRLDNGELGVQLLEWLNSLPEVKQVLENNFDSRPISKQNLHEWTRGGYQAWLRLQESREQVEVLREQSSDLEKDTGDCSIADRISTLLSVQLLAAIQQLDTLKDPKERWLQTKDLLHELHRLRREDHHAARIRLTREQWDISRERQYAYDRLAQQKRNKKRLFKWLHSLRERGDNARLLGPNWAHWFHCVQNDLPLPDDMPLPDWYFEEMDFDDNNSDSSPSLAAPESDESGSSPASPPPVPAQSESNPACRAEVGRRRVKPGQSKSNAGQASCGSPSQDAATQPERRAPAQPDSRTADLRAPTPDNNSETSEPSEPVKASQSKSNPVKPNQSKSNEATQAFSPEPDAECDNSDASNTSDQSDASPKPASLPSPDTCHSPPSSSLPSSAEMLRSIQIRQKFK